MIGWKIALTSLVLMLLFMLFVSAAKAKPVSPQSWIRTFLLGFFISLIGIVVGLVMAIWGA